MNHYSHYYHVLYLRRTERRGIHCCVNVNHDQNALRYVEDLLTW